MGKSIFISKNPSEIEPYRAQLEAKGYSTIIAHSFLSFTPVPFTIEHDFDVIFFGSPRAVIFFKAQQSISSNVKIACVGSKTAEVLESMGHTVDFVGETSSDPKSVARDFKGWLTSTPFRQAQRGALSQRASKVQGDALSPRGSETQRGSLSPQRVLFPVSDRSLKTISSVIDEDLKEEVVVYSTEVKGKVIPECDVYVFSSPSNVEGFFMLNELPDSSEVFGWGKSTEGVLFQRAISTAKIINGIADLSNF